MRVNLIIVLLILVFSLDVISLIHIGLVHTVIEIGIYLDFVLCLSIDRVEALVYTSHMHI
jgi:hypothetical protein